MKLKASELIAMSKEECVIISIDGETVSVDMFTNYTECDDVIFTTIDKTYVCSKNMDIKLDSRGRSVISVEADYPYNDSESDVHLQVEICIPMTVANFTKLKVGAFHVD